MSSTIIVTKRRSERQRTQSTSGRFESTPSPTSPTSISPSFSDSKKRSVCRKLVFCPDDPDNYAGAKFETLPVNPKLPKPPMHWVHRGGVNNSETHRSHSTPSSPVTFSTDSGLVTKYSSNKSASSKCYTTSDKKVIRTIPLDFQSLFSESSPKKGERVEQLDEDSEEGRVSYYDTMDLKSILNLNQKEERKSEIGVSCTMDHIKATSSPDKYLEYTKSLKSILNLSITA